MAAATGVSERTVYRLCKEAKEAKDTYEHATVFREPHNHRSATVTLFDEFEKCLLRRTVLNFYARKEIPTLEQVFVEMKEKSEFKRMQGVIKESSPANWIQIWTCERTPVFVREKRCGICKSEVSAQDD